MSRGPICSACAHKQRRDIHQSIIAKVSLRQITSQFGISKSTLSDHRIRCMGLDPVERIKKPPPEKVPSTKREDAMAPSRLAGVMSQLPSREEIGDRLGDIVDRLEGIAATCEENGSMALSIGALDKMRASLDSLSRLAGHIGSNGGTQVNVGLQVNISAGDIASALASHLNTLEPCQLIEASADEP